jgi:hypothetical protein
MKLINIFFIILFLISAALQYNDPDPYIWMPLYLYGVAICFLALRNKKPLWMYYSGLIIYSLYAIYLFFDKSGVLNWITEHEAENIVQSMKATSPWIEETREFFGLVLLIIAVLLNYPWKRRVV